jgi:hypothetical protein
MRHTLCSNASDNMDDIFERFETEVQQDAYYAQSNANVEDD